jgi:integrase/recombinase XerD
MNTFIVTAGVNRFAKDTSAIVEANSLYADSDLQLIDVFLRSRVSEKTRSTYEKCIAGFMDYLGGKTLRGVTMNDALSFVQSLADSGTKASTQGLKVNTIKSLFAFGHKVGYLPINVFAAVKAPK